MAVPIRAGAGVVTPSLVLSLVCGTQGVDPVACDLAGMRATGSV